MVPLLLSLASEAQNRLLTSVVCKALRKPTFEGDRWKSTDSTAGLYQDDESDLTMDVQGCEILWRNDGLRPVPDSMTQMGDYDALFGKESMQCGVVKRQEHRLWVHVVGTDCDLMEVGATHIQLVASIPHYETSSTPAS